MVYEGTTAVDDNSAFNFTVLFIGIWAVFHKLASLSLGFELL